jgi:hypothetical protein
MARASGWNNDNIDHNFTSFEGEQIKQLPIIIKSHEGQLMWMHSRDSYSSVKIGYNAIHLWHENKQMGTSSKDSQTQLRKNYGIFILFLETTN